MWEDEHHKVQSKNICCRRNITNHISRHNGFSAILEAPLPWCPTLLFPNTFWSSFYGRPGMCDPENCRRRHHPDSLRPRHYMFNNSIISEKSPAKFWLALFWKHWQKLLRMILTWLEAGSTTNPSFLSQAEIFQEKEDLEYQEQKLRQLCKYVKDIRAWACSAPCLHPLAIRCCKQSFNSLKGLTSA